MPRYLVHYALRLPSSDGTATVTDLWVGVESALPLDRDAWELEHGLTVIRADGMSAELLADLGVTSWREMPTGPRRVLRGGRS